MAWLLGVVGLAGGVYLSTLAPSLSWAHHGADGGDLAAAVATGGVPHPSGYPTYVLLGQLFARLPLGDLAHRLNVMSATWAALTVGVVYLIALRTLRMVGDGAGGAHRRVVAAAGALAFAFSPLFWSQALIVEVHTLHAFFVAVVTYLVVRWMDEPNPRLLGAASLAMGMGLGNHLTLALLGPPLLVLLWDRREQLPTSLGKVAAVVLPFFLGLSVYATLPLRARQSPPINWGDPRTVEGFLWTVTGRAYGPYVFALPLRYLPDRLGAWARLLVEQFGWWGLVPGLVGAWWLGQRSKAFARATLLLVVGTSIYAIGYDTADSHVYLIPAYVAFALWLAWGLEWARSWLAERMAARVRAVALCVLALAVVLPSLLIHYRALDLSADTEARDYAYEALAALAPDAVVVSSTDRHTFALWYTRYGEGRRPDVAVVDAGLLGYEWYRRTVAGAHPDLAPVVGALGKEAGTAALIRLALERGPVYVTDPGAEMEARYTLLQEGPVYRVAGEGDGP